MPRKSPVCRPLPMIPARPLTPSAGHRGFILLAILVKMRLTDKTRKLLHTLQDIPDEKRQAQFHCVLVYMRHADDPTPVVCHGRWPGVIAREPAGDGGFGYDPIFFVPSEGKTAAELTREEKSAISHRGQALKLLLDALRNG